MKKIRLVLAAFLAVLGFAAVAPAANAAPSAAAAYWQCVYDSKQDAANHLVGGQATNAQNMDTTVINNVRYQRLMWSNDAPGGNPFTWQARGVLGIHYDCSYSGSDRSSNPLDGVAASGKFVYPPYGYGPNGATWGGHQVTGHPCCNAYADGGQPTGSWAYPYGRYYP
jgi:hypothetical protein